MQRISTPAVNQARSAAPRLFARITRSAAAPLFARIKRAAGIVPNTYAAGIVPNTYATIGSLQPEALKAFLDVETALKRGSLSNKEIEIVNLAVSAAVGCEYCTAAHSNLAKLAGLSYGAVHGIRASRPSGKSRRDALAHFVRMLVTTTGTVTDKEFSAIKAAGYTDQQLVEISLAVALITFTNVFNRINDTEIDFPAIARTKAHAHTEPDAVRWHNDIARTGSDPGPDR